MGRKSRKKIIVAIALLLIFGIITVLALQQNLLQTEQYTVEEYFDVSAAIEPMGNDRVENNGTIWILHALWVTVKAVKGDAHGVVVQSWANSEHLILEDIPKGELRRGLMFSSFGARITQKDGKFSVTLTIRSQEATGKVSVNLQ